MTMRSRLALLGTLLLATTGARADTITLKRSVRVDRNTPVTLADIADLDGAHAERLAETPIAPEPDALPRENPGSPTAPRWSVSLASVRDAIDAQPGVNWAFLTLRGGDITLIGPATRPLPAVGGGGDSPTPEHPEPGQAITRFEAGTIGRLARGVVRTILRVEDDDLRIVWPSSETDFLALPVGEQTVHIQPIGRSDRMPLEIIVYDEDRIVRTETVRAEITVRRRVHVASGPKNRHDPIEPSDFSTREMWVGPGVDPAPEVLGKVAARRFEAGSVIETDDITPPLVVERGELITLHCVSGAIAIRTPARALADGRDGETVPVEMESTGRRVLARMNGRGKAVLVVPTARIPSPRTTNNLGGTR